MPINPAKPVPKRSIVAGMGTGAALTETDQLSMPLEVLVPCLINSVPDNGKIIV